MGLPNERFSGEATTVQEETLKGMRRDCAEAMREIMRTARYQAFKSTARIAGPYAQSIVLACHDIAHMMLDALPATSAYRGVVGLITHAANTRDAGELIRIIEELGKKGTLA